jgi:hypothetical protein
MFLVVIASIVGCVLLGAYLIDRHDRKNGHAVASSAEYRARLRAARKQRREQVWGRRNRTGPEVDPRRLYTDEPNPRRSH